MNDVVLLIAVIFLLRANQLFWAGLFEFFHYYSFVGVLLSGILRDKKMAYNLMYISNDDTQNYPLGVD